MRHLHTILAALLFLSVCAAVRALEPIEAGPTVGKTDAGCEISFTLAAPTDVTVHIVDREGNVVRHLAAGMVGLERAASPFKPKSLAQTIPWDGKTDGGAPAPAGCKARLSVGMRVTFDRFILWEPDAFAPDGGDLVVAGPNDTYYICQSRGTYCRSTVRVLNGDGKFVREFWPYRLNPPGAKDFLLKPNPIQCERDERAFELQGVEDWHGHRVPFCVCYDLAFYFHTDYAAAVVTADGYLVAVPAYAGRVRTSLWRLSPEGFPSAANWMVPWHPTSYPEEKDVGPRQKALWQSGRAGGWKLTAGRDGDFYLADGIHNVVAHFRARDFSPIDFTWSGTRKLETPRNTIGELNTPGDDADHFNFRFEKREPFGVVLDAQGDLLILDGSVVKTYTPDGRFTGSKPRAQSDYDKVHVALRDGGLTWNDVRRAGKTSGVPEALLAAARNERALSFPGFLRVDSAGRLYLSEDRNERTVSDVDGKALARVGLGGAKGYGYMAVDSEDNLYVAVQSGYNGYGRLLKFSAAGERLRFGDADAIDTSVLGKTVGIRGVFVARSGDIYLALKIGGETSKDGAFINVYAPDGTLKKSHLVEGAGVNDVAVDREG
ncbi:MAG TPA: hypothetical protein VMY39_01145, partial [Planctomycetota bacterium]|nr:hypothetical protein [Planctomycetota bacterium]